MFDSFRHALEQLVNRAAPPEERRALIAEMRDTLVQARAGLNDLRDALEVARRRLAAEQRELDTVRRRRTLAEGIGDAETVAVAERFEKHHGERVAVLARKVEAQEAELALTESEVTEMTAALKGAMAGAAPAGSVGAESAARREVDDALGADPSAEIDGLRRQRERAARDEDAARRLEELKRRMGK